ncbi:MAG: DegT/DnrJ/EryC1/StrS family aminotransferase [Verrucomicrobia bacterium]|nr:DegT/DnrJ/EryC1/StrS family aminotransferase [Verrucomicrobiota bacterium]
MIWRCDLEPQHRYFAAAVQDAINRVLPTGRYILASEVAAFEKEFAGYCGCRFAVGTANATDALTLSLVALGVGAGDEVISTPYTAIPTVSAIVDSGATPVFVDIRPDTFLMDLDQVAAAITPRTKAIMPVHIFGNVVDIDELRRVCGEIPIIEDASQAHGATLRGSKAGAFGDMGVFSFYPTKNLGAYGDGGIVVTDNPVHAERLRKLRMYGMVDKDHIEFHGVNSRLDELQAAILRVKLPVLDDMNRRRRDIAARYENELHAGSFTFQAIPSEVVSNHHVFVARYHGNREALIAHLDSLGIQTNIYYPVPLHLQEATRNLGYQPGDYPVAEQLCEEALALTMYPELEPSVLDMVVGAINAYEASMCQVSSNLSLPTSP